MKAPMHSEVWEWKGRKGKQYSASKRLFLKDLG